MAVEGIAIRVGVKSEVSREFLQGMADRMAVSFHKYGPVVQGFGPEGDVDAIQSLELRLRKYMETLNTEYLMDVANFAMIEFMFPREGASYTPTDSDGSPGRVRVDGRLTGQKHNLDVEVPK